MNLISAKTTDQIALKGIKVDWQKHDGSVKLLTLTDVDGKTVTIKTASSYSDSISVLVPEPPKKADRFVLHGEVAGIAIKKAFESEHEAKEAMYVFDGRGELEITKAEVTVDDGGVVDGLDDLPF
jgi:mannose-6-phosphate isomerase-like protein (cupin superfamily)